MDRRSVLRYIGVASAAALVLPSCVTDAKKIPVALNNLQITSDEIELMNSLASALIPATDTPGASEVEAHLYTFIMADDCLPETEQKQFLAGMRSFEGEVKKLTGTGFRKASAEEKLRMLNTLEEKKDELSAEVRTFYAFSRSHIIHGYLFSKHFMSNVKKYVHIPGPVFNGCKPLSAETQPIS